MANELELVNRVLPLILADGQLEVVIPLTWSLPGDVDEYNEPELIVLDARATALAGEICVSLEIQQDTYYVVKETGLVENTTQIHRIIRLIQAGGVKPGDFVELETQAGFQGNWQPERVVLRGATATMFTGDCKLNISYMAMEEQELSFVKTAGLDGDIMAETVDVEAIQSQFAQTFDLSLPVTFASTPKSMGQLYGRLTNEKVTPMCGWIKVEGDIIVSTPFMDENEMPKEESHVFPIKYFIEDEKASTDMLAYADSRVRLYTCVREPGATTGMLRGLLDIHGRLAGVESLEVAVRSRSHESFSPSHYGSHHSNFLHLEEVVSAGSSQTLIQREIFFGRQVRKVREPVDAQVRNLQHEIIPNKVIVRGTLHKQLFAVDAETGVVFAHDVDEKFVHFVDVPGASPGMRAHVHARVEFVKVDINPDGETARQVTIIEIRVKVTRFIKKDCFVKPLDPVLPIGPHHPHHPHMPSGRVYIVRSGDSIWKIARMFGVTMESIIAANNLQNPNLIFPGQKLIIPG